MSLDVLTWLIFGLISLRLIFRDALWSRPRQPWLREAVSTISFAIIVGSLILIILTHPTLATLLAIPAAFFLVPLLTLLRIEIIRLWILAGFLLAVLAALFRINLLADFLAIISFSFLIMFFLRRVIFDDHES